MYWGTGAVHGRGFTCKLLNRVGLSGFTVSQCVFAAGPQKVVSEQWSVVREASVSASVSVSVGVGAGASVLDWRPGLRLC